MPQPVDDDSTIRLTKPLSSAAKPRRVPVWAIVAPVLLVIVGAAGGWWLWRPMAPPAPSREVASRPAAVPPQAAITPTPPQAVTAPPDANAPPAAAPAVTALIAPPSGTRSMAEPRPVQNEFTIATATEEQILDHVPAVGAPDPTIFRFRPNPRILVLDFASLRDQGLMLNRVAALIEKSGLPHDRLLTTVELDAAIRAGGDTIETYYYGHDYGADSLIRFFALADRDNIRLGREEDLLGRLIRQEGWFEPNADAALISIPQVGADEHVTWSARATILHHELSHGEYFTNPTYVAFVHRFWTQTLTAAERQHIRAHLGSIGYDASLEEVMENEAQAYLMFTNSPEFFTPEMIGMSKARLAELRTWFYRNMPAGWLRDSLGQTLNADKTGTSKP